MPRTANTKSAVAAIAVIGIDIGKYSFHIVGLDREGAIALRQKWSRGQVESRLANMPPCLVGMEACVGAHHLARKLAALGHRTRLMPAKYVRPFARGQKNDFNDAEAIAEAVQRPTMKFVAVKSEEQLDLQALHRVREKLVSQRTAVINQVRAFMLERGIAVRQGALALRRELGDLLATRTDVLSPRMVRTIEDLADDWHNFDRRIENISAEIQALGQDEPGLRAADDGARHRPDHLERNRRRDWQRRWLLERARFRGMARSGAEADLHWRSHHPRQDIEARQSLSAGAVRAGRARRAGENEQLGPAWPQSLDRSREETLALQRARDRARQQARSHRLGGAGQGPQF